jgi:hypothetical protein
MVGRHYKEMYVRILVGGFFESETSDGLRRRFMDCAGLGDGRQGCRPGQKGLVEITIQEDCSITKANGEMRNSSR